MYLVAAGPLTSEIHCQFTALWRTQGSVVPEVSLGGCGVAGGDAAAAKVHCGPASGRGECCSCSSAGIAPSWLVASFRGSSEQFTGLYSQGWV